ncbi:MAG: hypothetical protein Q9201_001485 [Fulgogasparrea decipioides]
MRFPASISATLQIRHLGMMYLPWEAWLKGRSFRQAWHYIVHRPLMSSCSAGTVLAVIETPGTETTVSFSKFTSPSPQLKQSDSMVCIVEALQEIYSSQRKYGISTHLAQTWTYSGSQQPKNQNCLTMQNYDDKDHILTWGIVVEALRAVALGLGNTTSTACQFDVYSKQWGHVGYGSVGLGQGNGPALTPSTTTA